VPLILALRSALKDGEIILGVDENTALIGKLNSEWKVMGQSKVHIFTRTGEQVYKDGETLLLPT
jgi:cyanophycinase-like exopeptidase